MSFEHLSNNWWAWIISLSWQLCFLICIVAVVNWFLRSFSARLRYGLWLLILVKIFIPPTLNAPWSLSNSVIKILPVQTAEVFKNVSTGNNFNQNITININKTIMDDQDTASFLNTISLKGLLLIWATGCIALWGYVGFRYFQLVRLVEKSESTDEGPHRVMLEEISQILKLKTVPELYFVELISSPFLFGVVRPRVVIPMILIKELSEEEMRAIFLHELTHWKRKDTLVGWVQVVGQGVLWFHPFVWWANNQLRNAREIACDETVLQSEQCKPQKYGETIVRILTLSRGRSLVAGSLVGVFERGTKFQNRLEEIMNYQPRKRQFNWISRSIIIFLGILLLPMAAGITDLSSKGTVAADSAVAIAEKGTVDNEATKHVALTPYPQIERTFPAIGDTDVDPDTNTLVVIFDRPMQKGMSWTGEGTPHFPTITRGVKPYWKDDTTCVLPVKLKKGKFYRLGFNSKSFRNFKSSNGTPIPPAVFCFVTKGASDKIKSRVQAPMITKMIPENGAGKVNVKTSVLKVTFNMSMGKGMSWTGGGPTFPGMVRGKRAKWSRDGKTCTLPVQLKPNTNYQLGLNSLSHNNFQSKWGVSLKPVVYKFTTQ